jgi:hypothetical protein
LPRSRPGARLNDYLYQVLPLTSPGTTVAMMQGHLFEDPDAAWNAMMAAAIICAAADRDLLRCATWRRP